MMGYICSILMYLLCPWTVCVCLQLSSHMGKVFSDHLEHRAPGIVQAAARALATMWCEPPLPQVRHRACLTQHRKRVTTWSVHGVQLHLMDTSVISASKGL